MWWFRAPEDISFPLVSIRLGYSHWPVNEPIELPELYKTVVAKTKLTAQRMSKFHPKLRATIGAKAFLKRRHDAEKGRLDKGTPAQ